ncbi:Mu transposase C-terminal domain-containing protein [Deferrisoma palaeochoriense]
MSEQKVEENAVVLIAPEYDDAHMKERFYRILAIEIRLDLAALFEIAPEKDSTRNPLNFPLSQLADMLSLGLASIVHYELPAFLFRDVNAEQRQIIQNRLDTIAEFTSKPLREWIFAQGALSKKFAAASARTGVSKKKIKRWLFRYWKYGSIPAALQDNYLACGGRGKKKSAGTKKRGRPRQYVANEEHPENVGTNITDEIRRIIAISIGRWYGTAHGRTLQFVYRRMIEQFFSEEITDKDGNTKRAFRKNRPTYGQFYYWAQQYTHTPETQKARHGARQWALTGRGLRGRATDGVVGPGDRAEMDSTILDLYLASLLSRIIPIGRPILYVIIDVFSRLILGFHLALEGPSWNTARIALYNAFRNKVDLCEEYGITISEADWPCEVLPRSILVDNGELRGEKANDMIMGLGITVENCPPFRADWKGIVESRFRTLQEGIIHYLPGAVKKRQRERGERDYRLDAVLNIREIGNIICRLILYHNHHHEYPDLLTQEMISANVPPTPIGMWRWGLKNMTGSPRTVDSQLIYRHLLPRGTASVTESGIVWHGRRYSCATEAAENWRAIARRNGRRKIEIRYDPANTDHVWVQTELNRFEPCEVCNPDADKYRGLPVEEILDARAREKAPAENRASRALEGAMDLDKSVADIVDNATKEAKASGRDDKEMLKNIRENRKAEARRLAAGEFTEGIDHVDTKSPADISVENRLRGLDGDALCEFLGNEESSDDDE